MNIVRSTIAAVVLLVSTVGAAHAAGIFGPGIPDMNFSEVLANYDSVSGTLTASSSTAEQFLPADGSAAILNTDGLVADFTLTALVNASGIIQSGTFVMNGLIPGIVDPSDTLVTANLTPGDSIANFGQSLYIEAVPAGGVLLGDYDSLGIILNSTGFTAWNSDWTNDFGGLNNPIGIGSGTANIAAVQVPSPATFPLLLLGIACFGMFSASNRQESKIRRLKNA